MKFTPISIKRNGKYGSNYWEAYSPKLKRTVHLFSDLEYDHWVLIETNPDIIHFCEQPLRIVKYIEEKRHESNFDMWVQWKNGQESFIEIKYTKDLLLTLVKKQRASTQIQIQRLWCEENNYIHQIQTEKEIRANPII